MRFYCFYTDNYRHWVDRCLDSFLPWLNVDTIEMDNRQQWMGNCLHRATLLLERLLGTKEAVCLLDADLKCLQRPEKLLIKPPDYWDVLVHDRGELTHKNSRYCAGIIAFNYSEMGKKILAEWVMRNNRNQYGPCCKLSEQVYLYEAIELHKKQANISNLGNDYNYVVPFNTQPDYQIPYETVILHGDTSGPAHRGKPE